MSAGRRDRIGSLYERHAEVVRRVVGGRVNAPQAVIEDACHTAWLRLCARNDVALDPRSVLKWLIITATRESWRRTSGQRELTMGSWLPEADEHELPSPSAMHATRRRSRVSVMSFAADSLP
jgi:DNA-directed RNA polymerase specialized sigma24 family protein